MTADERELLRAEIRASVTDAVAPLSARVAVLESESKRTGSVIGNVVTFVGSIAAAIFASRYGK